MGNEQSMSTEPVENGKISEKHENGSVNGLSAKITSNGLETDDKSETILHQNGEPHSLTFATESSEYVIIESECQAASAQLISDIPDTTAQKEEVKKSKEEKINFFNKMFRKKEEPPCDVESVEEKRTSGEDQTDVSPPSTDPQQDLSGDEADTMVIIEYPRETAEVSTQTDRKLEADISTQTGDDEDVEETLNDEPSENRTARIFSEKYDVKENNTSENTVSGLGQVELSHSFGSEESKPGMAAEPESDQNESFTEDDKNMTEEALPSELTKGLPKVVADCLKAVFSADAETTAYLAVNTSEPGVDEVITEDIGAEAVDMSANAVLIESTEPKPNAVTPEVKEPRSRGIPSQDNEPVATVTETISEVVHEEPDLTPAYKNTPLEEPALPFETEILDTMESAHEEVAADDAEKLNPLTPDNPSENCDSCREAECVSLPSEMLEDALNSPDFNIKPKSIPRFVTTDDTPQVGEDMIAEAEPEKVQGSQPGSAIAKNDTEEIPEAAVDFLSQRLEPQATTPLEPATDNGRAQVEEVITATTFVPLSSEQEATLSFPEEPAETVAQEINQEATEALPNETETVPDRVEKDIAVQQPSTEGSITKAATEDTSFDEPVEENEASEDILVNAKSPQKQEQTPIISPEENSSTCEEYATTELVENMAKIILENPEVAENKDKQQDNEQADMPQMDATEQSEPHVSVQAEAPLEDADKETDAAPMTDKVLESLEATDTSHVVSEEERQLTSSCNPQDT